MVAVVRENALAGDDLKPWSMKMDFQVIPFGAKKPLNSAIEAWHKGRPNGRAPSRGPEQRLTGSEWSVFESEQYQSKPNKVGFDHSLPVLSTRSPKWPQQNRTAPGSSSPGVAPRRYGHSAQCIG